MTNKKVNNNSFLMYNEIFEQPGLSISLINSYFDFKKRKVVYPSLLKNVGKLSKIKRFVFLGSGSSFNAAVLGNYYLEEIAGINSEFEQTDEFCRRRAVLERGAGVVILSQSGRSKDALKAALIAREKGALIISISNNPGSPLDRLSDINLHCLAGPEKGIAATKSFFSQLLVLLFFAFYLGDTKKNRLLQKRIFYSDLKSLPDTLSTVLQDEKTVLSLSKKLARYEKIAVLGKNFLYPIALEGAHKIKEVAYLASIGISGEEFRHGYAAMLDNSFPVLALSAKDENEAENKKLYDEIKKSKAPFFLISDKKRVKINLLLPEIHYLLRPMVFLLALQLLAFCLARQKNIDPDQPRNIKKIVSN